jgi:iron complex outermembrane receptor protein
VKNGPVQVTRSVWLSLLLLGAASPAVADETNTGAQSDSSALDEVVVTAQKRTERLQDVPISISALSAADLSRSNVQTTSDLPSVVSGLVWSNQGAWVQPNLRGVYTTVAAVGAQAPIAIYLDGVYQPMQAGTIADLADVSRIEVLKGPQGTLFGRNATGGAISIYTLDPSFTTTAKVSASGGVYGGGSSETSGHYNVNGFVSGPLIDNALAGSLSAYYDHTDGYLTNDVNGQRVGAIDSEVIRGKLLWRIADGADVKATVYYMHRTDETAEAGFPEAGVSAAAAYPDAILPTKPWHITFDGPTPEADTDSKGGSIKGTFELDGGTLTSITGYSNDGVLALDDGHAAYSPDCLAASNLVTGLGCVVAPIRTSNDAWSQELDFASQQIGRFKYVAGLFGFYNESREHDSYNDNVFTDDTTVRNISYAAFTEGTFDVTDSLSAIAGVRVNHDSLRAEGSYFGAPLATYADKGWTSTTPRVSLTYKFNQAVNTYFTYAQGFKAGVVSGQANAAPPANPEKISSYEVGLKAAQRNYSLNLAAFYYDYRDLQVEVFDFKSLATIPLNAAKAEIFGIDFDGALKHNDAFQTRLVTTCLPKAEYTAFPAAIVFAPPLGPHGLVTDTEFDATGSRMLVTPLWTGTVAETFTQALSAGLFQANASLYYSSGYRWEYTGSVLTHQYNVLNGQASFTPARSQFRYTLYGKNLTNRAYIQGALPSALAHEVIFGAPREVGIKVDWQF